MQTTVKIEGLAMEIGKLLATIGVTLLVIGLIIIYAPWLISWFGKLPGDIRIEDEKKWVFIPIKVF